MDSLFLWEVGPLRVWIIWIVVFVAQIAIAEINRRWNWTIFALWTVGGVLMMPYAAIVGEPVFGWFPFGKYVLMVLTATMTGTLLVIGKRNPELARRYAIWFGVALWIGLVFNIMEANIRDVVIYFQADTYYQCAADWQCLKGINDTHAADMLAGLPEARGVTEPLHSDAWYQALAANFAAGHVGIDPATGFRTIGGYWNLMSAAAGLLNCITVTGLGKIIVSSRGKQKVQGLLWVDQVWPWIIAYDLWNHAFLYNALADYTWYCTLALLLACTIPAFTWAKGQWIWFRCFTLVFWISFYNWFPYLSTPPGAMHNFATMDPNANIFSSGLALAFNIGVFIYWLYKVVKHRRNPITNALFFEMGAFRNLVKDHCDDKDKYFLTDMIPETPRELGFEPESDTPPVDGYVSYMPWWKKVDKRWPKLRTPLSADPKLVEKGVQSDPQWDVKPSDKQVEP
ncbi:MULTISPECIES: DUF5692 family protein [Actinomycetaceae]|uniref:DUF5692 family protein n=1 Tax=Actinomycetaceae TaxID=2049 RepID=UPI0008A3E539|nr:MULTISPECIES: DUF5692 family protein [Actinomycetaceae]MDP9833564.1 hypothetical protein [Gleimia europaea]MDU6679082.1 DUF5692 family protein [Actinomyces sp.]OFR33148.1 hypothetical protein HMPREF2891_08645 [Actinomyces sp. HMSC065F11]